MEEIRLTVSLAAVGDSYDQDQHLVILNLANDAVVADPITPKALQVVAQGASETARVIIAGDALAQVSEDLALD